ncbi:MAG: PAS domain S-box protein [Bacteroidetes bacterium]|nr:PAS domain S-box protein [Bacteroidota bacterium]
MINNVPTELLSCVLNNINEGFLVQDKDNSIVFFNKKAEQLLGLSGEQLLGKTPFDPHWKVFWKNGTECLPEERPAVITNKTGNSFNNVILGVQRVDDSIVWLSVCTQKLVLGNENYILLTFHEVKEMVELSREVEKSNNQLELLISTFDDVILEVKSGKIVNGWKSHVEFEFPEIENILGKQLKEVFHERWVTLLEETFAKAAETNSKQYAEYRKSPKPDEGGVWYGAKVFPIPNTENAFSVIISDISRQKHVEEKLRRSQIRWQFALQGSGDGVWYWNTAANKEYYSPRCVEMFGYKSKDILEDLAAMLDIVIHPDDKKIVKKSFFDYVEGRAEKFLEEFRIKCKDGSYRWILGRCMIVERDKNGKPLIVVGTNTDIQTIKDKENDLILSEQKFSNAFKYSGIGKALVSPEGRWIEVNDAVCEFLGYAKEEFINLTFQDLTHPDDLEKDLEYVRKMLNKEIVSYQMEKRYIHKDNYYVWGLITVSLVWNTDGTPKFFISQIQDISEMKKLISDLELKNKQLEMTGLDLQQKLKQLEEFNRIVAHNIRGPAGNIKTLLNECLETEDEEEKKIYFNYLKQSSEQLLQTLTELMEILEVKTNKKVNFEDCNLESIISNVKNQLDSVIAGENAKINLDLKIEKVHYPKVYLESVLFNLISNALRYRKKDVAPQINISTRKNHTGDVIMEIEDNGLGIDLTKYGNQVFKLHKIFHPGYDSKGVGLFMTKNQIETFGGSIDIESAKDKGTKFIIKF